MNTNTSTEISTAQKIEMIERTPRAYVGGPFDYHLRHAGMTFTVSQMARGKWMAYGRKGSNAEHAAAKHFACWWLKGYYSTLRALKADIVRGAAAQVHARAARADAAQVCADMSTEELTFTIDTQYSPVGRRGCMSGPIRTWISTVGNNETASLITRTLLPTTYDRTTGTSDVREILAAHLLTKELEAKATTGRPLKEGHS